MPTSTAEAVQNLRSLLWEGKRLRTEGEVFVRSEVWHHEEPMRGCMKESTEPGLPKPGTVERVLMIEPCNGEAAFIRVGCSLRGRDAGDAGYAAAGSAVESAVSQTLLGACRVPLR